MSDWKLVEGGVVVLVRETSPSVEMSDDKSVSRLSVDETRVLVMEEAEQAVSSSVQAMEIEFV